MLIYQGGMPGEGGEPSAAYPTYPRKGMRASILQSGTRREHFSGNGGYLPEQPWAQCGKNTGFTHAEFDPGDYLCLPEFLSSAVFHHLEFYTVDVRFMRGYFDKSTEAKYVI